MIIHTERRWGLRLGSIWVSLETSTVAAMRYLDPHHGSWVYKMAKVQVTQQEAILLTLNTFKQK